MTSKQIRKQMFCLTSQARCANMPAARQTIHFFNFFAKNYQIWTHNDQKCQNDQKCIHGQKWGRPGIIVQKWGGT